MTTTGTDSGRIRLGTRGSRLALTQSGQVAEALMAAGAADEPAVERGAQWLLRNQRPEGDWAEEDHTGTGFPRVFYLRYHGYARIFPLWALARPLPQWRAVLGRWVARTRCSPRDRPL